MTFSALVVDDDPDFLGLTARILVDMGIDAVTTAADAGEALAVVAASRPDAVVVDIGLPDRTGIDLAYELSELPWRPRVILTSSDSDAVLALEPRAGRPALQFVAKEEIGSDALQRALLGR
jgi:CheY-like chemotaxis protein